MYNKSENLQAIQSKQMITDALFSLMKLHPYNDITITQICQEAKVVRQTFYRNFGSKTDILEFYFDNMFQNYTENYFDQDIDTYQELKIFFDYCLHHKVFLVLIEKNDLFFLLNRYITENFNELLNTPQFTKVVKDQKMDIYVLGFIASTVCSILSLWVKNDFEEPTEALANLAKTFFCGLERSILKN